MKRYLLDTHALLWMQDDNILLSDRVREIITNDDSELYVSIVTFWEITIKTASGKLELGYMIDNLL